MARKRTKSYRQRRAEAQLKMLHRRKPDNMSVDEWQIALRREYGRAQDFTMRNIGSEPIFSEFEVTNPQTKGVYRVAIRGTCPGDNFCSCPDFAVNTLGTCKHIEFTLAKLERAKGAKAAFKAGFQPPYTEIYLRYGARREIALRLGTEAPPAVCKAAAKWFDGRGILKPDSFGQFDALLRQMTHPGHEVRCYDDALGFVAQMRDKARLEKLVSDAFPGGADDPGLRDLLGVRMYPYQCHGALFAAKAGRCLLADDMGLGKTVQAIAAAEILARVAGVERVLVVCPTSLKHQWKSETERFTKRTAMVVEGFLFDREALYAKESFIKITNYDVIRRDMDAIRAWSPDLIILDEAQRIKNWKTKTAQAVKKLSSQYAIVLTGTPLENRLEELHSIVEFVDRFRLGPLFRFLEEHQHVNDDGRVVGYRNLSQIGATLEAIVIRRTKDQVLRELPERIDKTFFVPMTAEQQKHHEEYRIDVAKIVAKWRKFGFLTEADQRRLMVVLQFMRMSCNSTYLLDQTTDFGVKADELVSLLGEVLEERDTKVVIFSQWLRTHDIIVHRTERMGWQHALFHGGVPSAKRRDLIKWFKEDERCRLFLSTDAGGLGLNLQNAQVVVNMDQPWNPAVLEQRIGRVHRLGQRNPVRVVNFVSQGTIEHGMLSVLAFKQSLFDGVLDGGQDEVFLGGTKLTKFMESVEKVTQAIPPPMPPEQIIPAAVLAEESEEAEDEALAEAASAPLSTLGEGTGGEEMSRTVAQNVPGPSRGELSVAARVAGPAMPDTWAAAISAGLGFLDKLGQALGPQSPSRPDGQPKLALPDVSQLVARDDKTGQPYLRLPIPQAETLQRIADLLSMLAGRRER